MCMASFYTFLPAILVPCTKNPYKTVSSLKM